MAGIFDTELSESRQIQQGISDPGFAAPSRGASVDIDPEDTYNLRASTRLKQLSAQKEAERAARDQALAKQRESQRVEDLTKGLIGKYNEIDQKVTNPVEANRLKREVRLTALQAAGKENAGYINTIADQLSTKRQAREDGMIEVVDSKGNVIGLEAGSRQDVLAARERRFSQKVDETLPNTIDSLNRILEVDRAGGEYISNSSVSQIVANLKNQSGRLKRVADDYHVLSNSLPSSEQSKLAARAKSDYLSSVSGIFSTFTNRDIMKAIKAGSVDRSEVEIAMQQVRADIMDEIVQNQVGIDPNDIDAYINTTMENINDSYDNVTKNDLISLETQQKTLDAKLAIRKAQFEGKHSIPEIEGATKALDYIAKAAGIAQSYSEAAQFALDPADRDLFAGIARGATGAAEGALPVVDKVNNFIYQSAFDLRDFQEGIKTVETGAQAENVMRKLAKITSNDLGFIQAPKVKKAIDSALPKIEPLVESGEIEKEVFEDWLDQLGQFEADARAKVRSAGFTEEEYAKENEETMGFFSKVWNIIF